MISKISGIYQIICTVNGKYYIGSSKHILSRKQRHIYDLNKNKHDNEHLQSAYNLYGKNSFIFLIIEENIVEDQLLDIEQTYLDEAKLNKEQCYNMSFIAHRCECTPEIKAKIKISNSGKNSFWFGKKHSQDTKQKISQSKKGNCGGIKHPMFGKHHSAQTIKQLSIMKMGKNNPNFGIKQSVTRIQSRLIAIQKPIKQIHLITGETLNIWDSIANAARGVNIGHTSISKVLHKQRKSSAGFRWEYV